MSQVEAGRYAGSRRPYEQPSRWEKLPHVQEQILTLRKAAQALLMAQDATQDGRRRSQHETQDAQAIRRVAAQSVEAVETSAVASLAEALSTATQIMRGRMGDFVREDGSVDLEALRRAPAGVVKKYAVDAEIRRQADGTSREVEKVKFETGDQLSAARLLVDHYDGLNAPKTVQPTVVLALLERAGGDDALFARMMGAADVIDVAPTSSERSEDNDR